MPVFGKLIALKKLRFGSFYSVKTTFLHFSRFFKKHYFVIKISLGVSFGLKKKQRVRFSFEKNTTSQIFKKKFRLVRL